MPAAPLRQGCGRAGEILLRRLPGHRLVWYHRSIIGTGDRLRVFFDYQGDCIGLPQGETLIGRGISCDLRFNDQGVSRHHLKVIVTPQGVTVLDLDSTNGTRVNGKTLNAPRHLANGDKLQFGRRTIKIRIEEVDRDVEDDEPTMRRDDQWEIDDSTPVGGVAAPLGGVAAAWPRTELESALVEFTKRTCPRCRQLLPVDASACPGCGHRPFRRGPLSITQPIRLQDVERRVTPRHSVEIPMLYSSATLTFDAVARDISSGGIFVASELLDPMGTRCSLTLLPDGAPRGLRGRGLPRHRLRSRARRAAPRAGHQVHEDRR